MPVPLQHSPRVRVLLAEDDPVNQRVAAAMLAKAGCQVDIVCDGMEAVESALTGRYDVVLMDCQMPRMDGYEATRRIRAGQGPSRRIPIIAMTADAMPQDRADCLDAGMDEYLTKPVSMGVLLAVVSRWAEHTDEG